MFRGGNDREESIRSAQRGRTVQPALEGPSVVVVVVVAVCGKFESAEFNLDRMLLSLSRGSVETGETESVDGAPLHLRSDWWEQKFDTSSLPRASLALCT